MSIDVDVGRCKLAKRALSSIVQQQSGLFRTKFASINTTNKSAPLLAAASLQQQTIDNISA